jgi:acyl-CoA thioester hydrolase
MSRIRIQLPQSFSFSTSIAIRITDVNYGGHVGNDAVLSLIHEARMQFLRHFNFSEMNFGGAGMIMADVAIEFKAEAFYGDVLKVYVTAINTGKVSFDMYYKLTKEQDDKEVIVALAKTGMVCYDYDRKKIVAIPEGASKVFTA